MTYTYDRRANTGKSVEVKNWKIYLYRDSFRAFDISQASKQTKVPALTVVTEDATALRNLHNTLMSEAKRGVDFQRMLRTMQTAAKSFGVHVNTESVVW